MAKKSKKSDLNKKNSMKGDKVLGEFDESFRDVPILDRGHGNRNVQILEPNKNNKENQVGKVKDKDW